MVLNGVGPGGCSSDGLHIRLIPLLFQILDLTNVSNDVAQQDLRRTVATYKDDNDTCPLLMIANRVDCTIC